MKGVAQRMGEGTCLPCSIATILGLESIDGLPRIRLGRRDNMAIYAAELRKATGWDLVRLHPASLAEQEGLWIGCFKLPGYTSILHAVVMDGMNMAFDPAFDANLADWAVTAREAEMGFRLLPLRPTGMPTNLREVCDVLGR